MLARHLASSLPNHSLTPAQIRAILPPGYKFKSLLETVISGPSTQTSDDDDNSESVGETGEEESPEEEIDDVDDSSFIVEDETPSESDSVITVVSATPGTSKQAPSPNLIITRSVSKAQADKQPPSPTQSSRSSSPVTDASTQTTISLSSSQHSKTTGIRLWLFQISQFKFLEFN